MKKNYTLSFETSVIEEKARTMASKENRGLSNYIETLILKAWDNEQ